MGNIPITSVTLIFIKVSVGKWGTPLGTRGGDGRCVVIGCRGHPERPRAEVPRR